MENKQKLEQLTEKITAIDNEKRQIYSDIIGHPQFEDFENTEVQDRKDKYPDLYAMQQRLEALENEKEPLIIEQDELEQIVAEQERIEEGKQLYNDINSKIEQLEREIDDKAKQVPGAVKEIQELNKQIVSLKATEAYQNNDEETINKVKELEAEMAWKILAKNKMTTSLKDLRLQINELEKQKEQLVNEYGKEILPVVETIKTGEQSKQKHNKKEEKTQQKPQDVIGETKKKSNTSRKVSEKSEDNNQSNTEKKVQTKNQTVYSGGNACSYTTMQGQPTQTDTEQSKHKIDFDTLYAKCKKGTLTDKEFVQLAKIMQDPASYDKYKITTGIIFNKSKSILKAMAKMAGDSNTLSKEARETLGIAVEKPDKHNGLMSRFELMEWKGLKELLNNPGKKIAAEEQFKKVVALDRNTLTDEEKAVWDKAQAHLSMYTALRESLDTYGQVSKNRASKINSWLGKKDNEKKPTLPEAKSGNGDLENLSDLTNTSIDLSSITPKTPATKGKDNIR